MGKSSVNEELEEPLQISLITNWIFCPRRAWLEAAGEKIESAQITVGDQAHTRVDTPTLTSDAKLFRALDVKHRGWNVIGKLDAVQQTTEGMIIREFKATPVRQSMVVTPAMRIQLALQAACLRDMGMVIASTEIFFTTHHRRVEVELTPEDFTQAEKAVISTREAITSHTAPSPLEDSARCVYCSHAGICLPEERKLGEVTRRVMVQSPDHQVTHLTTPGTRASTHDGQMIVTKRGEEIASIPLESLQALQLHGNIDLTSGLIRELLWRNVPVLWCSGTGRLYGWTSPSWGPNGIVRVEQHVASHEGRLGLAREFISAKVHNQSVLLRRSDSGNTVLSQLRTIEKQLKNCNRWQDILGLEGEAASLYFSQFQELIKPAKRSSWLWTARMRRPAPDELNSLLDYAYMLLLSDCVRAITACGLDPHAGFLHSSTRNKPALALDLMEEFRAPIADSIVQTVVNNSEVTIDGFSHVLGSVRMRENTRKSLIKAYERRLETEITHPLFHYKATWRRTIEIQARLILGYLDGSQSSYKGIRIR
jgi:CRISPR-associated protein Cas1